MNQPGDADLLIAARSALLDALGALQPHLHAVVVIGAQAIYLHTGGAVVVAIPTDQIATAIRRLQTDPLAGAVTQHANELLDEIFATGPEALGSMMAGRAEQGIGDPVVVSAAAAALAADLAAALRPPT